MLSGVSRKENDGMGAGEVGEHEVAVNHHEDASVLLECRPVE